MKKAKAYQLILIPLLLVMIAVGVSLAYSWWNASRAVPGTDANYVKVLLEAEAQHWEKDLFLGHYSLSGVFFAISDSPETLASYFLSCTEGNYYRG